MTLLTLQNFYKETIAVACTTGATNIYVSTKPVPTTGYLVISPGNESLREIVKYTGTGTDATGDYVTIASAAHRGLGGTTDQAHAVDEIVRMNYTAEHHQEASDAIDQIVAAGAQDASTTTKGIAKLSTDPASATNPIAVGTNDPRMNATTGLTADKENALAGGGDFGTPSASNKFLTETYFSGRTIRTQYDLAGSPFTWTKQAGLKYIVVEAWGGGGNGSSSAIASRCGGGGGGGYTKKRLEASALGATETVTVGGSATNSTFGSLVTGYKGGNGGTYVGGSTVSGGGGGGITSAGSNGGDGGLGNPGLPGEGVAGTGYYASVYVFPNNHIHGSDGGGAGGSSAHAGGNSLNGGGGGGNHTASAGSSAYAGNGGAGNSGGVGSAGSVPGGGGGGGSTGGGAGGAGRIIVTEFYA